MSKYLIQTTEVYRADSETEAQEIIGAILTGRSCLFS